MLAQPIGEVRVKGKRIVVAQRGRKKRASPAHGAEGKFQIGTRLVDDPLEPGARLEVTVNVRESAIDHMLSRGRINLSQGEAGQRFRKLWEQAAIGRSKAIDPGKEAVDGGRRGDPMSDGLVAASQHLKDVLRVTGVVGSSFLISIVGEGKRVEDVARRWADAGGIVSGRRAEGYVTARMIEALDDLVRFWKLEASGKARMQERTYRRNGEDVKVMDAIRGPGDGHTGPATELRVGRFGDIVKEVKRPTSSRGGQRNGS